MRGVTFVAVVILEIIMLSGCATLNSEPVPNVVGKNVQQACMDLDQKGYSGQISQQKIMIASSQET